MRITVPEGKIAVVLDHAQANDLLRMCVIIRGPRRQVSSHLNGMYGVAGDIIAALADAGALGVER